MLLHQIEALVEVGVAHVVLAVSYHAEQLEQEMQVKCSLTKYLFNCSRKDVHSPKDFRMDRKK
jgi:NDP-sugar pyrophosphorylase family protein